MKRLAGFSVPPYEIQMIKKSGERATIEINAVAVKKEGKVVGDLAILRDVSERKKAEEKLTQSYQIQTVLNQLLNLSLESSTLEELLEHAIDRLISVPMLSLEAKEGGNIPGR